MSGQGKKARRHTSIVTVAVLDKQIRVVDVKESDISYKEFRGSGPGGQHRNKTSTAIRAVHLPSGISATAADSKSQYQNKLACYNKIVAALTDIATQEASSVVSHARTSQIGTSEGRGSLDWRWVEWRNSVEIPSYGVIPWKDAIKGRFPF